MTAAFVLDANVLYSARLRDLWLQLGILQVTRIVLTPAIEREWVDAVARQRPELVSSIARTVELMHARMPEAYLTNGDLAPLSIGLPDPSDAHVVQAAIACGGAIVTYNLADFPPAVIGPLGVESLSPDDAFLAVSEADEEGMLEAARRIRSRLNAPPVSAIDYAQGFARARCPRFSDWLAARVEKF